MSNILQEKMGFIVHARTTKEGAVLNLTCTIIEVNNKLLAFVQWMYNTIWQVVREYCWSV